MNRRKDPCQCAISQVPGLARATGEACAAAPQSAGRPVRPGAGVRRAGIKFTIFDMEWVPTKPADGDVSDRFIKLEPLTF